MINLTKQQIDDMRTSLGKGVQPFMKEAIDSLCALAVRGLAVPEALRSDKETIQMAEEVDLTLGGHPAFKLAISSRRVHALAKEVLRLNGMPPWDGTVRTLPSPLAEKPGG